MDWESLTQTFLMKEKDEQPLSTDIFIGDTDSGNERTLSNSVDDTKLVVQWTLEGRIPSTQPWHVEQWPMPTS